MNKLFTIVLLLISIQAFAQRGGGAGGRSIPAIGVLRGVVVDSATQEPVEYATVAMMNLRDSSLTGAITDAKGRFEITEIKLGAYQVKISFIGYQEFIKQPLKLSYRGGGVVQDLGKVKLQTNTKMMEGVEVVGERDMIEMSLDKKVFNVEKNIVADGGAATDVLQNIPSVTVDLDGNVSLRGSENVNILIDGKPSGLTGGSRQAILDQIPAASIERIEVITNPSAKYDAEGMAGIINIVTKKNIKRGTNGLVTVSVGTNDKYNFTGQINHRVGKLNTYFNYNYRYDARFRDGKIFRQNIQSDTTNYLDQVSDGDRDRGSHVFKGGIDYSFNTKNTLSFSVLYNISDRSNDNLINYNFLDEARTLGNINRRLTTSTTDRNSYDVNLSFVRDLGKPGQSLTFDARHSHSNNDDFGNFNESYLDASGNELPDDPFLQRNFFEGSSDVTTVQLDLVDPLNKTTKIEYGAKAIIRNILNDFRFQDYDFTQTQYIDDLARNNEFDYEEGVYSGYFSLSKKLGKWGFQGGVRAEQTLTTSTLITTDETFENDYLSFFPSGYLSYKPNDKGEFRLGYSRRINRPRTRQLNPFVDNSDIFNLRTGNPRLLPEFIDSYEVSYEHNFEKFTFSNTIYWRETHDMINRFRTVDENGVATLSYTNLAGGRSYGLETVFGGRPAKWWNLNISTNIFKSEVDASNVQPDLNNEAFSYSFNINNSFELPKSFRLQLTTFYRAPFATAQGEIQAFYSTNIAIQKKVLKDKGTLTVRVSDIFNNLRFRYDQQDPNFTQNSNYNWETRIGYISFSYRFGKIEYSGKRRKRGGNNRPSGGGDMMDME